MENEHALVAEIRESVERLELLVFGVTVRGARSTTCYVPVRYPHATRWVTVAMSESRASAATVASEAFTSLSDVR